MESDRDANRKQRLEWVNYWTDFRKRNTNEVWSKQQADFINSVMRSADVDPKIYMKVKKLVEKIKVLNPGIKQ